MVDNPLTNNGHCNKLLAPEIGNWVWASRRAAGLFDYNYWLLSKRCTTFTIVP
jgi:hypothetical protein